MSDPPAEPPTTEPTVTPEQTLSAAGIDDVRRVEYQRRMSTLLAGRQPGGQSARKPRKPVPGVQSP